MNQREWDELAEYVALIADEYERARHVLDRFPRVYEDQLDELRHGDCQRTRKNPAGWTVRSGWVDMILTRIGTRYRHAKIIPAGAERAPP